MQHIVKKQIFELTIDQSLNAFHIQERVSKHFRDHIVPMLNKLFDDRGIEHGVIAIDRMEIDLGIIDSERIETENWTEGLKAKIEKLLDGLTVAEASIKKGLEMPLHMAVLKQWFYYMQHGYLAWNTLAINDDWRKQALEALAVDYDGVQQLRRIILREGQTLTRIVLQHSSEYLKSLTEILTAQNQGDLANAIDELVVLTTYVQGRRTLPINFSEKNLNEKYWTSVLKAAAHNGSASSKSLVVDLIETIVRDHVIIVVPPLRVLSKLTVTGNTVKTFVKGLQTRTQLDRNRDNKKRRSENEEANVADQVKQQPYDLTKSAASLVEGSGEEKKACDGKVLLSSEEDSSQIVQHFGEGGIMVSNAGLVLLHPFLKTGFNRLGLLDGKQFIDESAREKALYLLHYLATGRKRADEHELVIPKIICDFPLEQAVHTTIELSDDVYKEADELLDAVTGQWEKLQNASHDALREGFLQRPGKLSEKNQEDLIQVEKSSIDILLNYLPWSLSLIMLPWRRELLRVEWC